MSYYCSICRVKEGAIPNAKQMGCKHFWKETKVRTNITMDTSLFLWLKDKAWKYRSSMSGIIEMALLDYKINDAIQLKKEEKELRHELKLKLDKLKVKK